MCVGAPLTQSTDDAIVTQESSAVMYVPFMAVWDASMFEKVGMPMMSMEDASAFAMQQIAAQLRHVSVDDQLLGKTKLCKFFSRGHCTRGKACTFAHGRKELRAAPDLFKTELCFEFMTSGMCHRSESCQYAHGEQDLRMHAGFPTAKPWGEAQELRSKLCILEAEKVQFANSPRGSGCGQALQGTGSYVSSYPSFLSSNADVDTDDECGWVSNSSVAASCPVLADDSCEAFVPETDFDLNLVVKDSFLTLVPTYVSALRRSKSVPAFCV